MTVKELKRILEEYDESLKVGFDSMGDVIDNIDIMKYGDNMIILFEDDYYEDDDDYNPDED